MRPNLSVARSDGYLLSVPAKTSSPPHPRYGTKPLVCSMLEFLRTLKVSGTAQAQPAGSDACLNPSSTPSSQRQQPWWTSAPSTTDRRCLPTTPAGYTVAIRPLRSIVPKERVKLSHRRRNGITPSHHRRSCNIDIVQPMWFVC